MSSSEALFKKAAFLIKNGPPKDTSQAEKLKVYGLFKQASSGDVEGTQPWAVQLEARAKWDAWEANKGMSKEDAQKAYVSHVTAGDTSWESHEVLKDYKE